MASGVSISGISDKDRETGWDGDLDGTGMLKDLPKMSCIYHPKARSYQVSSGMSW